MVLFKVQTWPEQDRLQGRAGGEDLLHGQVDLGQERPRPGVDLGLDLVQEGEAQRVIEFAKQGGRELWWLATKLRDKGKINKKEIKILKRAVRFLAVKFLSEKR